MKLSEHQSILLWKMWKKVHKKNLKESRKENNTLNERINHDTRQKKCFFLHWWYSKFEL